ncbi:MAG: hypothetical protein ACREK5_10785 [Gemmatimonadota bacterium]
MAEEQIEFSQIAKVDPQIRLLRAGDVRLQVQVGGVETAGGAPQVGQLLIMASTDPQSSSVEAGIRSGHFKEEAEAICDVFETAWPEKRQVVSKDSALRILYDAGPHHAFEYIWEHRLHQSKDALQVFGRPVLGGGLRFVIPPQPTDEDPVSIEIKVESFLRNPKKIFVETQMQWPKPQAPARLNPSSLLQEVETFAFERVVPFLTSGEEAPE